MYATYKQAKKMKKEEEQKQKDDLTKQAAG
jgi:hypothetical protein